MPARVAAGLILFAAGWCITGAIRTAQDRLWFELWRPGGYTFGRLSAIYIVHLVPPKRVTMRQGMELQLTGYRSGTLLV